MKKETYVLAAAVAALTLGGAGKAQAQIFTPTFMAPRQASDLGVYVSDGPGDLAIEGIWRRTLGTSDLGLRLGFADLGDGALMGGIEYRNPLRLAGTAPVDIALTLGGQAVLGDVEAFGGQVGLSFGYTFTAPEVVITPYIHPRLAIVNADFGAGDGDDETDVEPLADLGVDFGFSPNLVLRFGVNLGKGADWGIGLAWRTR